MGDAGDARIVNRGFETSTTDGWQVTPLVDVLRRDVHGGRFALRLFGDGSRAAQTITGLTPNTTYQLSVWGQVTDAADTLHIGVQVDGGLQRESIRFTAYHQVSQTFTAGASGTVTIFCEKQGGEGEAFCDDFTLSAVGEIAPPSR